MMRCVVFDFDGTLIDSNSTKKQIFYDVVRNIPKGKETLEEIYRTGGACDRYSLFQRFADMLWTPEDNHHVADPQQWADSLVQRYTEICDAQIIKCDYCPGALYALENLTSRKVSIYINSATPQEPLVKAVNHFNLVHYFVDILGSPNTKEENLITVIEEIECSPYDIVMVGDGENDRLAAEKVGCHFIAVGKGACENLRDLPHLIKELEINV